MNDVLFGSYEAEDVTFLLKDLSGINLEGSSGVREKQIQAGGHYSESLPIEEKPGKEYMDLFWDLLESHKKRVALYTGIVAEQIYHSKGKNVVLVSLARAGTPIGALIKRYILDKYGDTLPHYSISIIRGKGVDENALRYILARHQGMEIQFIDGWTGKGAISRELQKSCKEFQDKNGVVLDDNIAVLADPGCCSTIYGTREDFLLPSACLNSTVSGLISRTVLNEEFIKPDDFHGAKYYKEFEDIDVSKDFLETINQEFPSIFLLAEEEARRNMVNRKKADFTGLEIVKRIAYEYGIGNINLIKPGVGETTRVLLRRVPWKILIKDFHNPDIKHILLLAKQKEVELVHYPNMDYACCGLIKQLKG
ncbi:cysteine protease StiP family protein [Heyndrickxia sp. MSNUG]|uniref:cysteine protease StiP family protein n=1 Tax=Heyndrickxia sp. MSNUG TaxID=3136677 RepID=UPI003C2AD8D2